MAEAIITKILDDARAIVNSTLEEGGKHADQELAVAQNDAKLYIDKYMQESYAMRDEIVKRRISVANLEVRKLMLAAKKALIDKVFEGALEDILALPKDEYLAIIKGMLKNADDGDVVSVAERDVKIITKAFIDACAKEYGIKLALSNTPADIKGGIVLTSGEYDKNLSLEVELALLREELEPQVAQELFARDMTK